MKCVRFLTNPVAKQYKDKVVRLSNEDAKKAVDSHIAKYASKADWKKTGRCIIKNNEIVPTVKE